MATKTGIVFTVLILGSLALPAPESDDVSVFFRNTYSETRIVGGSIAAEGSHPHMVALTTGTLISSFTCGGSIVTARTVLTAAHCIEAVMRLGSLISSLRLTVGTNTWNSGGSSYRVSGNATHPNYVRSIIKNDIGFLYASTPIVFSDRVQPIQLSFDFIDASVLARAAGWGRIVHNGAISARLLELTVSTVDGEQCERDAAAAAIQHNIRGFPGVQPHLEICTLHSSGAGFGMCNGDSGSALARVHDGQQIGLVSWGLPCALGAPDMFVRISAYESWVNQHIRN